MKIQQNKEERFLALLIEGATLDEAVDTTMEEFPVDKRMIKRENGLMEILD